MEESTKEVIVDAREMLANATGPLEYGLTNDYLFKAFLQKNQRVLRALVASLLHMGEEEIVDITVKNPEGKESHDICSFKVDGEEKEEKNVALFDDGKTHYIEILI